MESETSTIHQKSCRGCRSEHTFGAPVGMGQELQRIGGMCLTGYGEWGEGCRHYAEVPSKGLPRILLRA